MKQICPKIPLKPEHENEVKNEILSRPVVVLENTEFNDFSLLQFAAYKDDLILFKFLDDMFPFLKHLIDTNVPFHYFSNIFFLIFFLHDFLMEIQLFTFQ